MAPPNPKRPSRPRPPEQAPKKKAEVELPFDDGDVTPLHADDPRPQRVTQYPTGAKIRRGETSQSSAVSKDQELPAYEGGGDVADPGFTAAFVYVERGPGAGQLVPVRQGVLLIGRASTSGLRLQHPSVSRRHAQLSRKGERFFVRDLASQNGTYVNQVRIEREIEVFPGDELVMGTAQLRLRGPNPSVQSGSVRRTSTNNEEATPRHFRVGGTNITGIAAAAGAVGFGLAAILLFTYQKLTRGPSYEELDAPQRVVVTRVDPPAPEPAAVAPATPPLETRTPSPPLEHDAPPAVVTRPVVSAQAPVEALRPAPKPSPKHFEKPAAAKPVVKTVAMRAAARPEPAAKPAADATVMARYEAGNVSSAIDLARKKSERDLAARLAHFQSEYESGQRALANKDESGAFRHLEEALRSDESLSGGWGTYNGEIRKLLSELNTVVGTRLIHSDPSAAKKAFSAALKYDPENAAAKASLATMSGKRDTRSQIDAAFGE